MPIANSSAPRRCVTPRRSAPFKLRWFEEPCDPLDFALFAELAGVYDPPLATGENLYSTQDVENLVRFGGFRAGHDIIQIDPPQAYGIGQYARTIDMLARHGWPRTSLFPHGGNQMSLAMAAGFGLGGAESYPGVFGDFGGFADDARIANGAITLVRPARHRLRRPGRAVQDHARVGGLSGAGAGAVAKMSQPEPIRTAALSRAKSRRGDSDRCWPDSTGQLGATMRMDAVDYRSSQSDQRTSQDDNSQQSLMTPARRAALDALEREFRELLNSPPR